MNLLNCLPSLANCINLRTAHPSLQLKRLIAHRSFWVPSPTILEPPKGIDPRTPVRFQPFPSSICRALWKCSKAVCKQKPLNAARQKKWKCSAGCNLILQNTATGGSQVPENAPGVVVRSLPSREAPQAILRSLLCLGIQKKKKKRACWESSA